MLLQRYNLVHDNNIYIPDTISSILLPPRTQIALMHMISQGEPILFIK